MLKVREVVQKSVIWFDEPEIEKKEVENSGSESSEEEDLAADYESNVSPHAHIRDLVAPLVDQKFNSIVPFKFINDKQKAIYLTKSSVNTCLIVSGRAGFGLIDSLF